ncbi:unnamed protein product [Caenorhabditis auriculariae]|uniref:Trimethylguanosine synthase n=1 Tax=Caenorhabditis auriculariae TaxID=2777116 RepID=A0A8S1GRP7_9PELO|nr:unnamed protein product [Caenorhabditis auriculariae]
MNDSTDTLERTYLFPWTNLLEFDITFDSRGGEQKNTTIEAVFLEFFLKDSDLLFLSREKEPTIAALQKEMERCEINPNSNNLEVGEIAVKGDPYRDIPKYFGTMINAKYGPNRKRKVSQKAVDFKTFEEYWETAQSFVIYTTWEQDFGDLMDPDERFKLQVQIKECKPYLLIDHHFDLKNNEDYKNLAKKQEDCPNDSYESLFKFHCEVIEKQSIVDFAKHQVVRLSNKAQTFLNKLEKIGFVPGFTENSLPMSLLPKKKTANENEDSGTIKAEEEVVKEEPVVYEDDHIFADLQYTLNDKYSQQKTLVWNGEEKSDKVGKESSPTTEIVSGSEVSFAFDPEKEAHLIASNAAKLYADDPEIRKYFFQRYRLFSKLDEGIIMDREGWFSVTPERIAQHIADRIVLPETAVIVDAFAGVGGNTIQFALRGAHVIAIDMDPVRLKCARQNAKVYGVEDRISFICADFFHVAATWTKNKERAPKVDAVFLSPPWGGPGYLNTKEFDLNTGVVPNGIEIFNASVALSPNIAYFLPRNTKLDQLIKLAGSTGGKCEVEQSSLNSKIKTITAYYGNLAYSSH